ncbi:MAG: alpha/beta fold hydrolase [Pseudomonadota bacterium]
MFDPQGTAYDLTGREGAPVVVLIHGLGLTREITWRGMLHDLEAEFRVLNYDLLGHGESAVPHGTIDLTRLSEQLIALLDHLDISHAALMGFSLGGMINRRVAMDHPDRVRALIILNSPHERDPERQAQVERQAQDSDSGGPAATLDAALARWLTSDFTTENKGMVDEIRAILLANNADNYAKHRYVLAAGVTELIRPDPPLAQPMLVMTCAEDSGSTPAMSRAIAAESTNAQALILPDLKHMGLLERPDLFLPPCIRFLRSHA